MERPVAAREDREELDRIYFRRWKKIAVGYVRVYAVRHRKDLFIADDVIAAAWEYGLDQPINSKNWGPVFQEAQDMEIIASTGTVHAPNRRNSMTTLWRSLV
jgi:uncharacterized protein